MKIHLPSRLRKALLACLAAMALPATLPSTIGSASGIAAVWLISSQAAQAIEWQELDVNSSGGDKELTEDTFSDSTKGLRKLGSGILTVPGDFSVGGLYVGAGEIQIAADSTLTAVNSFENSGSTIAGDGTLAFGGSGEKVSNTGTLSVKHLTYTGSPGGLGGVIADEATLGGTVSSSVIEVTDERDTLTVTNFTGGTLEKQGAGTLVIGDTTADNNVSAELTLGAGTLDFTGKNVTLALGNLTWTAENTTLKLSGAESSTLNLGDKPAKLGTGQTLVMDGAKADIVGSLGLGEGSTLSMQGDNARIDGSLTLDASSTASFGKNAYVRDLTLSGGTLTWKDREFTVGALHGGAEIELKLSGINGSNNVLVLGEGDSNYAGSISGTGTYLHVGFAPVEGAEAGVGGSHSLSGKVNVSGIVVEAGELTLFGHVTIVTSTQVKGGKLTLVDNTGDTTKGLKKLTVEAGGVVDVKDGEVHVTDLSNMNGEITGDGTLKFDAVSGSNAEGTLSVAGLKYTGNTAAELHETVSSTSITVEGENGSLTVDNFVEGGSLAKHGKGKLTLKNEHDSYTWTGAENDKLELWAGELELSGKNVKVTVDFPGEGGNTWQPDATLSVSGTESSTLVGDVTVGLGRKLNMGKNATIEGDVVVSGSSFPDAELTWVDTLKVDSLSTESKDFELDISDKTLILGGGISDFKGKIKGDGGDDSQLKVTGGEHTLSGQLGPEGSTFDVSLSSGTLELAEAEVPAVLKNVTFEGEATLKVGGEVKADHLSGNAGSVTGAGTLHLTQGGNNFAGMVGLGGLTFEDGANTLGDTTVRELVLGEEKVYGAGDGKSASLEVDGTLTLGNSLTLTLGEEKGVNNPYVKADSVVLGEEPLELNLRSSKVHNSLTNANQNLDAYLGSYYLVTGLAEGTTVGDFALNARVDFFAFLAGLQGYTLKLDVKGDSLVLVFSKHDPSKWVWEGNNSNTWDASGDGWGEHEDLIPGPNFKDVYFEGTETTPDGGKVTVKGRVVPDSVHVTNGEYVFEGTGSISSGGVFSVEDAKVDMKVAMSATELDLKGASKFIVDHADALGENTNVVIDSTDAVLAFGEDGTTVGGAGDVLTQLDGKTLGENIAFGQTVGQDGVLNVQVGLTYKEFVDGGYSGGDTYDATGKGLTIGGDFTGQSMGGLTNVAEDAMTKGGIDKTGRLGLTLEWDSTGLASGGYDGAVTVEEGKLTLKTHGLDVTLTGNVTVHEGSVLELLGEEGQTIEVQQGLQSGDLAKGADQVLKGDALEARVVLGSREDEVAGDIYKLSGDNSGFRGTIELAGDAASKDVAVFGSVGSAGGEGTKLVLSGRALTYDMDKDALGHATRVHVNAGEIEVTEDTINMVGGYGVEDVENDVNKGIELRGKITGSGVLANAELDYHHYITGDLSGFHGAIVAGYVPKGATSTPDAKLNPDSTKSPQRSSWYLHLGTQTDLNEDIVLAGTGVIQLAADNDLTLKGAVGSEEYGNTVDLENHGEGDIILQGENTTTGALLKNSADCGNFVLDGAGAEWAGSVLGDGVTFTLVEGTLTGEGGITEKGEGAKLEVEAKGVVNLGGTSSDLLGDITVYGNEETKEDGSKRHGRLVGIGGKELGTTDRKVTLVFDGRNMDNKEAMLAFEDGVKGTLHVTQDGEDTNGDEIPDSGLILDFTTSTFVDFLKGALLAKEANGEKNLAELHIVEGVLDLSEVGDGDLLRLLTEGSTGYGGLLADLGFTLNADRAKEGWLSLSGTSRDVYLVLGGEAGEYGSRPHDVTVGDANSLIMEGCKAVVVDEDTTFTVTFDDTSLKEDGTPDTDVTLNNLIGLEGSTLDVKDGRTDKSERLTVTFDNSSQNVEDKHGFSGAGPDGHDHSANIGEAGGFDAKGQDTTFEGTITAADTVDFEKTGVGQLTIGGALGSDEAGNPVTGSGGILAGKSDLKLLGGGVTLQGNAEGGNELGSLTFAYGAVNESNTGLALANGADLTVHDIIEEGGTGGDITLGAGSFLTFDNSDVAGKHGKTLSDTRFTSNGVPGGTLMVDNDSELTLNGKSALHNVSLWVTGDALTTLDGTKMDGSGNVKVDGKGDLTMKNAQLSGIGYVWVAGDGKLTMDDSTLTGIGAKGRLLVEGNGEATLNNKSKVDRIGDVVVRGDGGKLTLNGGSTLSGVGMVGVTGSGKLTLNDGSTLTGSGNLIVESSGEVALNGKSVVNGVTNVWVAENGKLSLDDGSKLTGKGNLTVSGTGKVTMDNGSVMNGIVNVGVTDTGKLTLDNKSTLTATGYLAVAGSGEVGLNNGSTLTVGSAVSVAESGKLTLNGSILNANGDLTVLDNAEVALGGNSTMGGIVNVTVGVSRDSNGGDEPAAQAEGETETVPAVEGGKLSLDASQLHGTGKGNLVVFAGGKVTLGNGSVIDGIIDVGVAEDAEVTLSGSTLGASGAVTVTENGSLTADASTLTAKSDLGVGGNGTVTLSGGTTMSGVGNVVVTGEGGKLTLDGTGTALNATGHVLVVDKGEAVLDRGATLKGGGVVSVGDDGKLTLSEGSTLSGYSDLDVGGNGVVAADGSTLGGGSGVVSVGGNGRLTLDNGSTLTAGGDLVVVDKGAVALNNSTAEGIANVFVTDNEEGEGEGGKLTLDDGSALTGTGYLAVAKNGEVVLDGTSTLTVGGAVNVADNGKLTVDNGSALTGTGPLVVTQSGEVALDKSTLTVGGAVNVADNGKLTADDSALKASGDLVVIDKGEVDLSGSTVEGIGNVYVTDDDEGEGEGGKLTLNDSTLTGSGSVVVAKEGEVTLNNSKLMEGGISSVVLADNGKLSLDGDSKLGDIAEQLVLSGNATLDIGKSAVKVGALNAEGQKGVTVAGDGGTLTVTGAGAFTGTLAGTGTLDVQGGNVTLTDVSVLPNTWNLGVTGGSLTLIDDVDDPGVMKFKDVAVNGNSNLKVGGAAKSNVEGDVHLSGTGNTFVVGLVADETDVTLDLDFFGADGKALTEEQLNQQLKVELDGPGSLFFHKHLYGSNEDGWHLLIDMKPVDLFTGADQNVQAGGNLLVDADKPYSAAYKYVTSPEGQNGDLAAVLNALKAQIAAGPTPIHAERIAAAVAGSSTAILSSAGVQDVHRQMESIRNRATAISTGEMKVNADPVCKPMHSWVNAESGYHKTDGDGYAPGYTLDGWGGTIGIAREYSYRTTGGLALTAMYNDIKSDTADYASGDFDTTYLSGFLTTKRGPWTHAFLATLGKADVSLDRTVNYGTGSYHVSGDTDGYAAGFMYEVSYTKVLNKERGMTLQPLFNVEFRHMELEDYNENGSDAGLRVGDLEADVVTFGLGARFQAALAHNAFGRAAMFEARVLGKVDTGDDNTTATNRLLHGTLSQEVEAAEVGKVGVEIGAGITVPLRSRGGTLFMDASVELRESYTNFNASAGYKYNF